MEEEPDSKPPVLSREEGSNEGDRKQHQREEDEDIFEEIDDEEEEDEEIVPVLERNAEYRARKYEEPTNSYENPRQPEILHEYEEAPLLEGGVRCQLPKSRRTLKYTFDHSKYFIDYRPSHYKSKTKNSHNVAIVAKVDANIYHEFSYNRTSDFDGSKFYTCLGCRKAKSETKVKDVVRTIRIDERYRTILSKGDPFSGHHFACVAIPWAPDHRSYGHVLPQPMHMDLGEYTSELVYVDADGSEAIWDNGEGANYLNIPFYGETGPPPDSNDRPSTSNSLPQPVIQSEPPPQAAKSLFRRFKDRQKLGRRAAPKCHLCFRVLRSTEALIAHLQIHVQRTPSCHKCGLRISVDDLPTGKGPPPLCSLHRN